MKYQLSHIIIAVLIGVCVLTFLEVRDKNKDLEKSRMEAIQLSAKINTYQNLIYSVLERDCKLVEINKNPFDSYSELVFWSSDKGAIFCHAHPTITNLN